ncbi:MAG: helix-turn-helix domain-containing protein [Oscillospiraceae bacterium]|nr:helix-turn-helix domain-containing protein [Oscillospiraceae bacterium]
MDEKKVLTRKEFISIMRISEPKAQELLNSKDFYPSFKVGRRTLINAELLQKWLNEQCLKYENR